MEKWAILLEYKEKLAYCKGGRSLERLPRETVESPFLKIFKTEPPVMGDPALSRGLGVNGLQRFLREIWDSVKQW